MSKARRASRHRTSGRLQINGPIRSRCASDTWSKFKAHATGIPSSDVKTNSVANPRIVRVAGATTTSFNRSSTSSRVRMRTGRRLSGRRNVYQRISPRFKPRSPSPHPPKPTLPRLRKTPQWWAVSRGRGKRRRLAVWRLDAIDERAPEALAPQ